LGDLLTKPISSAIRTKLPFLKKKKTNNKKPQTKTNNKKPQTKTKPRRKPHKTKQKLHFSFNSSEVCY